MACRISSLVKSKSLVLWLTGLTIAYQIVYQITMFRALERDAAEDECSNALASSPRCMELRLFRTWQKTAPLVHDLNDVAVDGDDDDLLEFVSPQFMPSAPATLVAATVPTTPAPASDVASTTGSAVPAAAAHRGERSASHVVASQGDVATTSWSPMTAWARGLEQLQQQMEQRLQSLPGLRRKRQQDLSDKLDHYAESITKSLAKPGNFTSWGHEIESLQQSLETRKAALPSEKRKRAQASSNLTKASGGQKNSLLDEINSLLVEMCEEPHRRGRSDCVKILAERSADRSASHEEAAIEGIHRHERELESGLASIAAESEAWQRAFDDKVTQAHKELCEVPERRNRPDCIRFLASVAEMERSKTEALRTARHLARVALRSNISKEAKDRAASLDRRLVQIASDRQVWENELLNKYGLSQEAHSANSDKHQAEHVAVSADTDSTDDMAHDNHEAREMHWPKVRDWTQTRKLRGSHRGRVVFGRRELRAAHWAGRIPKVACITAIKSSLAAKIQMKYFIENFHKQSYEGPTQLVFVYHHKDREAAKMVKMYADGFHIKGVAAQGAAAEFPSTLDLRYGAFTAADADVIAEWSFDEWHHPQQLSLQVRALALASRPGCLLRTAAALPNGAASEASRASSEETLLGDAQWMREHWHPGLAEQHAVLESAKSVDIVEVDMATSVPEGSHAADSLATLRAELDVQFEKLAKALQEVPAKEQASLAELGSSDAITHKP